MPHASKYILMLEPHPQETDLIGLAIKKYIHIIYGKISQKISVYVIRVLFYETLFSNVYFICLCVY